MDQEPSKEYFTFHEFLALWHGSEKTLRRRLKDGSIPKYQPGGPGTLIAIPRTALDISQFPQPKIETRQNQVQKNQDVQIPGPKPKWRSNYAN